MTQDDSLFALKRFGLGPGADGAATIKGLPREALLAELADPANARLDAGALPDSGSAFLAIRADQEQRRLARTAAPPPAAPDKTGGGDMAGKGDMKAPGGGMARRGDMARGGDMAGPAPAMMAMAARPDTPGAMLNGAPSTAPKPRNAAYQFYLDEIDARIARAKSVPIGYVERLVQFWTNHFAVQAEKDELVRGLAGSFEREAIRPFVLGRFEDMLIAATRHPAMLTSLDNASSIGPDSPAGIRQKRGLNENHARELMELHTVGVGSGYDQRDVTSLAAVLTGWTFNRDRFGPEPGDFVFKPGLHEPGDHSVMGRVYREDAVYALGNEGQGLAVLHDLAAHPATARHLALKLARHFVADDPPQALVDRLAASFRATGGNLKALASVLVQSDEAWSAAVRKFATPQQFAFSSIRAFGAAVDAPMLVSALNALGQPLWSPPSPEGFHDDKATWLAPDAMTTRLEVADRIAQKAEGSIVPSTLVEAVIGPAASPVLRQAVARAESQRQALALVVMSPEFLWR